MEDRETLIENMEYMENVKDFLNEELTNPYHYTQMQSFDDANETYRVDIPLPLYLQEHIEQNFGKSFDVICITKGEDTCSFILAGDDCQENIYYTKEQYKTFIEMAEKELAKDKSFNFTKEDISIDDITLNGIKEPILEQQKAEELLRKFKQVEDKVNNLCDDLKSKRNGIKSILFDCMKNLYKEKERIYDELHYDCSYRFDVELGDKLNIYYDGKSVIFRKVNGANLDFEEGLQIFKDNNFTKETIEKAFWNDMTTLIESNLASIEKQHDKLIEKQKETENSTNEFMQTFTKKDTKSNDKGVDR